jgi:flagellar hook-associated protein 3 FlgL
MRIATAQYQATMSQSLTRNQSRINDLTAQLASGDRLQLPSDDPISAVRISRLKREEAAIDQYRKNISTVRQGMTKTEGYLSNMISDMMPGRDLLVWASDGGNAPDDLNAMVNSLEALRDSLTYSANAKDQEGHYMFSGTATGTAPIKYDPSLALGSRYQYVGNEKDQVVVVGDGLTQVANQNVSKLEELLNKLDETIAKLSVSGVNPNDPAVRTVVAANLDGFDDAINLLSGKVATLGGQQNILKTIDANHENVSTSNQMAVTEIGQLDYGAASIELTGYSTALQASYKAYAKIGNLSLFAVL